MSTGFTPEHIEEDLRTRGLDPDAAAREMGAGDVTVLPSPLIGRYTSRKLAVVEVAVQVPPETPPVYLDRLIDRLKLTSDVIAVVAVEGSELATEFDGRGFVREEWWSPALQVYETRFVWRYADELPVEEPPIEIPVERSDDE